MPSHIALRGLPIENLKRKPFRTGALLAVVTILALTFFGGTMLTMNLNIMVVEDVPSAWIERRG